jgi:uncharacterized protein (TIGR03083 family)
MNAKDVLIYGHLTVLEAVEGLPETEWDTPGVCGYWSVREILAHLASFEHMLVELLNSILGDRHTPTLDAFSADPERFNDIEVSKRQGLSAAEVLAEYQETYERAASLLDRIPAELFRTNGLLAWYGPDYDLEDFITYAFYGHKREHCAQIAVFRDGLGPQD